MGQGAGYSPAEQSFQTGFHQKGASACWFPCQSNQLFPGVGVGTFPWGISTRSVPSIQVAQGSLGRDRLGGEGGPLSPWCPHRPLPCTAPMLCTPSPAAPSAKLLSSHLRGGWLPQVKPPAWRRAQGPIPLWPGRAPAPGCPILPGGHRAPAHPLPPSLTPPAWPLGADVPRLQ